MQYVIAVVYSITRMCSNATSLGHVVTDRSFLGVPLRALPPALPIVKDSNAYFGRC